MISLKNKGLKNRKGLKLCKMHKMKRPYVCRNGKVKLNMTKVITSRNFRVFRKKLYVNGVQKRIAAEKTKQRR